MLTPEDLKNIKTVVDRSIDRAIDGAKGDIISSVGEVIEQNILPQIAVLPSKAFITDKFADLEGSVIARQRKEDQKVNELKSFEVFQTLPR
ncbi:MAG: hypothetical protein HYV33_04075 [Candidatus Kerfeldbacteria bacterium]|nr:hypothetical protein [Candidatus Kerfeldbacteria bacterium]